MMLFYTRFNAIKTFFIKEYLIKGLLFIAAIIMVIPLLHAHNQLHAIAIDATYVSNSNIIHNVSVENDKELENQNLLNRLIRSINTKNRRNANEQVTSSGSGSFRDILNPDGSIKSGIEGSYNASGFKMSCMADGSPRFLDVRGNYNCDALWSTDFNGLGANNNVAAIAVFGGNLYVGGAFTAIGNQSYSYVAMWDGSKWNSIGTFAGGVVQAFAIGGSKLYIGGLFTAINGSTANRLAVWDGSTLSPIISASSTTGVNAAVYALAVSGNMLYVGGNNMIVDGVSNNIISFNLDTNTWVAMGSSTVYGLNNSVRTIAVSGNNVYIGGFFTTFNNSSSPVTINRVAVWNTQTSTWSTLTSGGITGVSGNVYAIAIDGNNVYVGGGFTTAGNVAVNNIACWNQSTNTWSALTDTNTSLDGVTGTSVTVYSLAVSSGKLYVGGIFSSAGGNSISNIAVWQSSQWSAMGTGTSTGTTASATVFAIAANASNVYAGGSFFVAGGVVCNRIATWNGSSWASIDNTGSGYGNGLNGTVYAIAKSGNNIYVGGSFVSAGSTLVNYIAKWDGSSWSALGTGVSGATTNIVNALAISGNNLYVGGTFTTAGGVSASNIAIWNMQTSTWSAMGSGLGTSTTVVNAIAVSGSNVYAGGNFTTSGSNSVNRIAMWNGSTWVSMDGGVSGTVYAITVSGSNIYVGGSFATAGTSATSVGSIAVWNGTSWGALGSGTISAVYSIAVAGGNVYAGGNFVTIGTATSANGIAYWNGSTWNKMSSGINTNGVYAITSIGSSIYIAGGFTTAGGATNRYVSVWNGSAWVPLGTGLNQSARAIITDGSKLYIGGQFTIAGNIPAAGFSIFSPTPCWTGATSTDWETASNWDDGISPQAGGDVLIPASGVTNEPTLNSTINIKNLTVQSGRTLTLSYNNTLGVSGTLMNAATITGIGTLVLNGTSAQSIVDSTSTINNLTLNNPAGATIGIGSNKLTITGTYTPTAGTLTTNGNLVLASYSTGAAKVATGSSSGGYINGAVTVQRYIPGGRRAFRFIAHPFSGNLALSSLTDNIDITGAGGAPMTTTLTNSPSAFGYDNANGNSALSNDPGWTALTAGSTFNAKSGYRILVRGSKGQTGSLTGDVYTPESVILDWTGNLNQGNQVVTLTNNGTNKAYSLIGNPYATPVNLSLVTRGSNINANFSVWDPNVGTRGAYRTEPFSMHFLLPSGAAFFTQAAANTNNTITFTEASKSLSTVTYLFRNNGNHEILTLEVNDVNGYADQLSFFFGKKEYSANNDVLWDAAKMTNPDVNFYSFSKDGNKLAIDRRPASDASLASGFVSAAGNYKIVVKQLPQNNEYYLKDNFLGTTTLLTGNEVINIVVTTDAASHGDNRFELVTKTRQPVLNNHPSFTVTASPNPVADILIVSYTGLDETENTNINLVTGEGKVVKVIALGKMRSGKESINVKSLPAGPLVVQFMNGKNVQSTKIVKE